MSVAYSLPVWAKAQTCKKTSQDEIGSLFVRWNDSLKTGDPEKVVENYADNAVLLPTISNVPRVTRESKKDYFTQFLEKKPVGAIDARWIMIQCNDAIDTGLYTFKFGDGNQVKARYTFTYHWDGRNWLITTHHSSAMPESN